MLAVSWVGGSVLLGLALRRCAADRAHDHAAAAAVFSAGWSVLDPTVRAAVLREVRAPAPAGWDEAALETTWESFAERILDAHTSDIDAVGFAPDGRVLAGSRHNAVWIWPADSPAADPEPLEIKGQPVPAPVAWTRDGKKVLVVDPDGEIRVESADPGGSRVYLKPRCAGWPLSVAFSPDGEKVVAGSSGTACVWSSNGTGPRVAFAAPGSNTFVAFGPDGRRVLLASSDAVRIGNADGTGRVVELTGAAAPIAVAPDGTRVATGSPDGSAKLWNADGTGEPVPLKGHSGRVTAIAFGTDGKRVITGSDDRTARVWNVDDPMGASIVLRGHASAVTSVAFAADGTRAITGSDDHTARVWSLRGTERPLVLRGHGETVTAVAFSPDGKRVATASSDGSARVWRVERPPQPIELEADAHAVTATAISADGTKVVTGSQDGVVRVWAATGAEQPVVLAGHTGAVVAVAISPDSKRVLTASMDRTARIWAADGTGKPVVIEGGAAGVFFATFSADGQKVLVSSAVGLSLRNADGSGPSVELRGLNAPAALSPDGRRVLSGRVEGPGLRTVARIVSAAGGGRPIDFRGHGESVTCVAFSSDGKKIATGSADRTVRVWNSDGSGVAVELRGHTDGVMSVAFSPDGQKVATGSGDGTARVWNADDHGQAVTLRGHVGFVSRVLFSPDGKEVLTGSTDGSARIWNADGIGTALDLGAYATPIVPIGFSSDGAKILTTSGDGADNAAQVWIRDARTLLWRESSLCLPPARRELLLAEDPEHAREAYRHCLDTVERCRTSFGVCREAVAAAYGENP